MSSIPWVKLRNSGRAYLYVYGGELADGRVNQSSSVVIYTGGGTSAFATKILWAPTHAGRRASLTGARLDGPGGFRQQLEANGGSFPSIVNIPRAGCWRLTLRTGRTRATMVVRAVDPPAAPSCNPTPLHPGTQSPIDGPEPWLTATPARARITGTIFYLPSNAPAATIYPNRHAPGDAYTKILWKAPRRTAGTALVVRAVRLDAPGLMAPQAFPAAADAYPGVSFPSGIDVSSTGCWLLTIRTGKAAGVAVFASVPAA